MAFQYPPVVKWIDARPQSFEGNMMEKNPFTRPQRHREMCLYVFYKIPYPNM